MTYGKVYDHKNADYRAEAFVRLREVFPVGSTATTIVRHVSRSGMTRTISVLAIDKRGEIRDVSSDVARVLDWSVDRDRGGVRVDGCGMDMCFHLVYSMSRAIHAGLDSDAGYAVSNRTV